MKKWKCPECHRWKETDNNVKIAICNVDLSSMEEIKEGKNGGTKSK